MARIYSNTNKIKFTNIADSYKSAKGYQSKISENHAKIVTYAIKHFKNTRKYKQQVVDALNLVTYYFYAGEWIPSDWKLSRDPLNTMPKKEREEIEETIGDIFLTIEAITWDVTAVSSAGDELDEVTEAESSVETLKQAEDSISAATEEDPNKSTPTVEKKSTNKLKSAEVVINPTPKQDLYIQPPTVPLFDYNKPWMGGVAGADSLIIYTTLPEVPRKQNEISVTTDVSKMTPQELMKLYPNRVIHTRASVMYESAEGIELDEDLGLILPIEGYTREQLVDNIIKYPHIFQLKREVNGKLESFYSSIEIDGKLVSTLDVWDSLPESKLLPRQAEFVKEYVVRRYLLERDVKGIEHKYPIFGSFDKYLTLFMSIEDYINHGHSNVEEIVKQCVLSRVAYKQTRNPVIRRLMNNA